MLHFYVLIAPIKMEVTQNVFHRVCYKFEYEIAYKGSLLKAWFLGSGVVLGGSQHVRR
jgi:hypothetical protein